MNGMKKAVDPIGVHSFLIGEGVCSAFCSICAVAMGYELWAVSFNRSAARHYVVIGAKAPRRLRRQSRAQRKAPQAPITT